MRAGRRKARGRGTKVRRWIRRGWCKCGKGVIREVRRRRRRGGGRGRGSGKGGRRKEGVLGGWVRGSCRGAFGEGVAGGQEEGGEIEEEGESGGNGVWVGSGGER